MTKFRLVLKWVAICLFFVYLVWNCWWLGQLKIPPALIKGLTGLPSPTTGGTRSFFALCSGDFGKSFYYNPLTVPFLIALMITVFGILFRWVKGQSIELGRWVIFMWMTLFFGGWIIKLFSPIETW